MTANREQEKIDRKRKARDRSLVKAVGLTAVGAVLRVVLDHLVDWMMS